MFLLFPIAWPTSKLLDWALEGDKGATVYRRGELKALIGLHEDGHGGGELSADEVNIIRATLDLSNKSVKQVMTPLEDVYMLSIDRTLDRETVREIRHRGHSRIPVFEGTHTNVRAMFLVKNLIDYDPHDCLPIRQFPLMFLPIISGETNLFDALNLFQEGRSHMALVAGNIPETKPGSFVRQVSETSAMGAPGPLSPLLVSRQASEVGPVPTDITGIVTLEDVIEELIGEEIIDETDEFIDVHTRQRVKRKPWKSLKSIQALVGPYLVGPAKRRGYGSAGASPNLMARLGGATPDSFRPDSVRYARRGLTAPNAIGPADSASDMVADADVNLQIPDGEVDVVSFVNGGSENGTDKGKEAEGAPPSPVQPRSVKEMLDTANSPEKDLNGTHSPTPGRRKSNDEELTSSYMERRNGFGNGSSR